MRYCTFLTPENTLDNTYDNNSDIALDNTSDDAQNLKSDNAQNLRYGLESAFNQDFSKEISIFATDIMKLLEVNFVNGGSLCEVCSKSCAIDTKTCLNNESRGFFDISSDNEPSSKADGDILDENKVFRALEESDHVEYVVAESDDAYHTYSNTASFNTDTDIETDTESGEFSDCFSNYSNNRELKKNLIDKKVIIEEFSLVLRAIGQIDSLIKSNLKHPTSFSRMNPFILSLLRIGIFEIQKAKGGHSSIYSSNSDETKLREGEISLSSLYKKQVKLDKGSDPYKGEVEVYENSSKCLGNGDKFISAYVKIAKSFNYYQEIGFISVILSKVLQ